jgi:branched-chain amino acid transport system ATP-binding protein
MHRTGPTWVAALDRLRRLGTAANRLGCPSIAVRVQAVDTDEAFEATATGVKVALKELDKFELNLLLAPTEGRIHLLGEDISHMAPHQRVRRGLVRTFQINQLFEGLTPLQTLAMTVSQHLGMGAAALRPLGHDPRVAERCEHLLSQFHLLEVMDQPTQQLAYGKRRLLEMAIALACEPSVLLLDEPVAGVPAGEREELLRTVAALPADVSVLLIEHDMDLVFSFANSMTVMVNGAVLTEGTPAEMAADARVREVYLGHGGSHG